MCGIGGLFHVEGDLSAALNGMNAAMAHRGPDDARIWVEGASGLCHRRLSIIDLAGGSQPMQHPDGCCVVAFNGEIYNFRELRDDLSARGCVFHTRSDTEVLLHGYRVWGDALLDRLNGMFAFILVDRERDRVLMARDHLGIKPLYIARVGAGLAAASELSALVSVPAVRATLRINPAALVHYMSLYYIPDPMTVYREVQALPPAHLAVYERGVLTVRRYWRIPSPSDAPIRLSYPEAVDRLDDLLRESVRRQLVSDVPLGAFLSGGVDSSVVVAQMAALGGRVRTFTVGFEEGAYDERPYARSVASHIGTEHLDLSARWEMDEDLDLLLLRFGQPFADSSALPTYLVSRITRDHVTVALSGDGGDELFGGYLRYDIPRRLRWLSGIPQRLRKPLFEGLADHLPPGLRGVNWLRGAALDPARYATLGIGAHLARTLLDADFYRAAGTCDTWKTLHAMAEPPEGLDTRRTMQWLDAHSYLPGDILTKVDRMSMAVSLETRVPLLDKDIVSFAFSLPPEYIFREGRPKAILKDVLARYIPRELIDRPKMGFGIPLGDWFRGIWRDRLVDELTTPIAGGDVPLNRPAVRVLINEHMRGFRDHQWRLWQLYTLSRWWRLTRPTG